MFFSFKVEGDNISKLEKADILELTVRHLTKLHSPKDPVADAKRFQAGFGQCAAEACQFILSMPDIDSQIGQNLINHLRTQITDVPPNAQSSPAPNFSPQTSPEVRSIWSGPSSREYVSQPNSLIHQSPPPQEYNTQKRQELPHIPVNQSLVCDTSVMNSTPRIHDLSQPMTGLLMTVDNGGKENPQYSNVAPTTENEIKKRQNAEVKNVIMQKIREQILGRQVRDADPKAPAYDVPNPAPIQHQYKSIPPSTYVQEHVSSASVDLRKKSKGESKHFSPRLDSNHVNYQQLNNSKLKREDANLTPEAINYSTVNRESNDHEKFRNIDGQHAEGSSYFKKRNADYRNIHPKKVFLQPMNSNQDVAYDNNAYNYQRKTNASQITDHHSYSTLRRHRLSNPSRHAEYSHDRYAIAVNNQRYSPYHYKNEAPVTSGHRSQLLQMQHEMRYEHGNLENEQEENMWRPW